MQHTASPTQPSVPLSFLIHSQEDPVTIAENRVVALLDELENIGALQRSNRMELADFLNPPDEAHGIDAATDKDIFDAVMEARREEGRHDDDDSDTLEPIPTRVEALKAASTIIRYTLDKDGAYFRELESMLALFGQRTRTIN
jgi:hypothetical protein